MNHIHHITSNPGGFWFYRIDGSKRMHRYTPTRHAFILARCAIAPWGLIPVKRQAAQPYILR